jgi:dihydroorotate dehydrogenase
MLYKRVLKPILFRFSPEKVHDIFVFIGEFSGKYAITRWIFSLIYGYHGKDISKIVDGIKYNTPVMLSAGFDYNGRLTQILASLGFAGEEIGSVTAYPCEGNPKPRLTRLIKSKSIIVNKGLRNDGVDTVIARIKSKKPIPGFVIGVSIARTNNERSVPIQAGIDDYLYSFRRLNEEKVGDYYTINISCPNAFGGEAFTTPILLDRLLQAFTTIPCNKPIYIKMPINLPWENFKDLLDIIKKYKNIKGVIIGNLNKDYSSLDVKNEAPFTYVGGLSGKPCTHPSTFLVAKTREYMNKDFTVIGCGGIMSPDTAMEKFTAGADLIHIITGMIFEGPGLVRKILKRYQCEKNASV